MTRILHQKFDPNTNLSRILVLLSFRCMIYIYIYVVYIYIVQWFGFYVSLYTYEITCLTSHIYNISSFRTVSQSYRFCCQCATCHVILEKPFFDQLQGPGVREAVWVGLGWNPQSSTKLWWVFSEWLDFWTEKFVAWTFLNRTYLQKKGEGIKINFNSVEVCSLSFWLLTEG